MDKPKGEEQYIFIARTTNKGGKYALERTCGGSGLEPESLPGSCRG